jgi:hippurate hydrolase
MLKDALFERFPCDTVFGMHNHPGMRVGTFAIRPGTMMAGGGFFDIHVEGRGAHGARPEQSIDPVLVACHITTALQAIVARNVSALDSAVVSATAIKAGDAYNVIPQSAEIRGTVRTFRNDTMDPVEKSIADRGRRCVRSARPRMSTSGDCSRRWSTTRRRRWCSPTLRPNWSAKQTSSASAT